MALFELLDKNELQRLQDEFCAVAGVSAYCLDHEGTKITRLSGDDKFLHAMQERMAFERVQGDDSLEDLAIEDLRGLGQVAALSIKARGSKELYWIVYRPVAMSEAAFFKCLELLRDASISFLQGKIKAYGAQAESIRNENANRRMEKCENRNRTTAHILQLLESQEPIEDIMNEWLRLVSTFLELDTAQVFKLQEDGKSMDVICEWRRQGLASFFDKTSKVPAYSFLKRQTLTVINSDEIIKQEYREVYAVGVKAIILYPICPQDEKVELVLSLNERKIRVFDEEEVRFVSDVVKVLENILICRMQKNSLLSSRNTMESILDNVNTCLYVRDERMHKMLFANKLMLGTFGEEIKGGTFRWLMDQVEGDEDHAAFQGKEIYYEARDKWYDVVVAKLRWTDGNEARLYSLYDISKRKHYQGRIERQAYTDFLTGLYNRICCERDLAIQIDSAKKNKQTGALLYLDLDDFKHINDGLGHQYGDALLKAISQAFQSVPGIEHFCYRMGGDEFVIIIPPESYDKFERILADIQKIFKRSWSLKDSDYYCTMSMGVVNFPENGDSVPDLVKKADIAMYAAKKAGKNRIEFYSDNIASSDRRRLDMEKNMRDATARDFVEFEVYYQPIIDVQGEEAKCAGAEALIRWNSSKLGFVTPVEFIPLAEYLGLINPIGNHVLLEACKQCKEWNDKGFDYKVNVNLSVVQLLQRNIVDIVNNALIGTGLAPEHLTLEVTESLAINDMERMKKILGKIKELGVKIALDDFGTGYSSLNHIREIPFDIIKVDQSFVKDLAEDAYSQSFIKLVSELAETIGVNVCVEGIETAMQHQVLQGMRIKYIQGYYYDKPMSRGEFERKYCRKDELKKAEKEIEACVQELADGNTADGKMAEQEAPEEKTDDQKVAEQKTKPVTGRKPEPIQLSFEWEEPEYMQLTWREDKQSKGSEKLSDKVSERMLEKSSGKPSTKASDKAQEKAQEKAAVKALDKAQDKAQEKADKDKKVKALKKADEMGRKSGKIISIKRDEED